MMKKYNMKRFNIKNYLVFGSILLITSFMFASQVLAQDSVDIIYETDPLFSDLNIMPGDESVKWVKVGNNLSEDLLVSVLVNSYEDDDNLGSQMRMMISENGSRIYESSLADFLSAEKIDLSKVSAEKEKYYTFKVDFLNSTGNDYQGKSPMFDLSVVGEGENSGTSQSVSSSGSRSSLFIEPEQVPLVKGEEGFPELFINKESSVSLVNSGGQIEYTINIENRGNIAAYEAILEDDLPDGFTFSSTGLNKKIWNLGNIYPDEYKTITYLADVNEDLDSGIYSNSASLYASNHDKIDTSVSVEVEKENVKVLGIEYELPASGFSIKEFVFLLSFLFFSLLSLFIYSKEV